MRQLPGRSRWSVAVVLLAALLAPTGARAHGATGEHDGPAWCGARLAVPTETGVLLVDGAATRVWTIPIAHRLMAWSPRCDRIAWAAEHVGILDVATGAWRDLGRVPSEFQSAHRLEGPLPTIRFSPSGARFAVPVAGQWRYEEGVVLYTVATGHGELLALPRGEVHALAMLSEDTAVAAVTPGGLESPVRLFRATTSAATAINTASYKDPRMSIAPVVIAGATAANEAVVVDVATGAERRVAADVGYVRAVSADGSHLLCARESAHSSFTVATAVGASGERPMALDAGIVADWEIGLSGDGQAALGIHDKQLVYDDGRRPGSPRVLLNLRARGPQGQGEASHCTISADGTQAAFLYEVDEGKPKVHLDRCDFENIGRIDLYRVALATQTPRRVQTITRLHHCAVE